MKCASVCVCLNGSEKRKNVFEMMSKSAQTFRFLFGPTRPRYYHRHRHRMMLLSTLLSSSLCFNDFQYVCLLNCAQYGPPHYAHVHTHTHHPAIRIEMCEFSMPHLATIISTMYHSMPCHSMKAF